MDMKALVVTDYEDYNDAVAAVFMIPSDLDGGQLYDDYCEAADDSDDGYDLDFVEYLESLGYDQIKFEEVWNNEDEQ